MVIKVKLTAEEYKALALLADDGKHQKQTPDELAHDIVAMYLLAEQSSERP